MEQSVATSKKPAPVAKKKAAPKKAPPAPVYGQVRTALEVTIEALNKDGRLGPLDSARIAIARVLASVVDLEPESAILWREYRSAEKALREESNANEDPFDHLLRSLSTTIRDEAEPKKPNSRR
jgi:hypothetical protein